MSTLVHSKLHTQTACPVVTNLQGDLKCTERALLKGVPAEVLSILAS